MKIFIYGIILLCIISCSSEQRIAPVPKIGEEYQDGIVFYILKQGDFGYISGETHGFISYKKDLNDDIWGCQDAVYTEFQWEIGTGNDNTDVIIEYCNKNNAAYQCKNIGWYLPNSAELELMYINKNLIPDLKGGYYWSSNKVTYTDADALRFTDGDYDFFPISSNFHVRPIKKF